MDIWTITFDTLWEREMIKEQLSSLNNILSGKDVKIHVVFNEFTPHPNYKKFIETVKSSDFDIDIKFYMVDEIIIDGLALNVKSAHTIRGWYVQQFIKLLGPIKYGTYENQLMLDSKNIPIGYNLLDTNKNVFHFLKNNDMRYYRKTVRYYTQVFDVKTNLTKQPTTPFLFKLSTLYKLHEFFDKDDSKMLRHLYSEDYAPAPSEFCFYNIFEQRFKVLETEEYHKTNTLYYYDNLRVEDGIKDCKHRNISWVTCRNDNDVWNFKRWIGILRKYIDTSP
ncbi:MAG: hypothetical protein ACON5K_00420 [Bacteroidia bacterium]